MPKKTWVNVNGAFKEVKSVWQNINGVWIPETIPKGNINGIWKEFMEYNKWIYNEGIEYIPFYRYQGTSVNLIRETNHLHFIARNASNNNGTYFKMDGFINVNDVNELFFEYTSLGLGTSKGTGRVQIAISSLGGSNLVSKLISTNDNRKEDSINVKDIDGDVEIRIRIFSNSTAGSTTPSDYDFKLYNMYFK